jgi:hypothetical protein
MTFKEAHEKIKVGEKITTGSRVFTKKDSLNGLNCLAVFEDGDPVTLHDLFFYTGWKEVVPTTTTITTQAGRKIELSIKDAGKLNLL